MANKFACGLILFSVLIALTFGVAFAEKTTEKTSPSKPMTSMNKTNVTMNKTMLNKTMNKANVTPATKPAAKKLG